MGQNQDIFLFRFLTVFETHLTIFRYFLESWNIFFDGFWCLWCISDQVLDNFYPFDYICLSHFSLKIHKYHTQTFFFKSDHFLLEFHRVYFCLVTMSGKVFEFEWHLRFLLLLLPSTSTTTTRFWGCSNGCFSWERHLIVVSLDRIEMLFYEHILYYESLEVVKSWKKKKTLNSC